RHGAKCRLLEQSKEAHRQSRATDLHARTFEAFFNMGVDQELLARGHRRHMVSIIIDGKLVMANRLAAPDTPFPFDVGVPQCDIESVLEARFASLGGVVERGVRVAGVQQGPDSVEATLLLPDGRWEDRRFGWLVGCDGARSTVRRSLEVLLEGST